MGRRANPTIVGAFTVGAVALAMLGTVIFGSGKLFQRRQPFVLYFDSSVNGLEKGAPVKFRGVQVGAVDEILLSLHQDFGDPRIPVIIALDQGRMTDDLGIELDIANPAYVQLLIDQGLRARLQMQSLVTGLLYIELDLSPETPVRLVRPKDSVYLELPTLPTTLQEAQSAAKAIIAKLGEIDIPELVDSATAAVKGINDLVRSPALKSAAESLGPAINNLNEAAIRLQALVVNVDGQIGPVAATIQAAATDTNAALKAARGTLESVQTLVEPEGPTAYQLKRTLEDVSDAARAVRQLADYLERNPGALVRGRAVPESAR